MKMIKFFTLSIAILLLPSLVFGQVEIDCASTFGNTTEVDPSGFPIDTNGGGDEGDYTTTLSNPQTVFLLFEVTADGSYFIELENNTIAGDVSVGVGSIPCQPSIDELQVLTGDMQSTEVACLVAGTTYVLVIASEDANVGTVEVSLVFNQASPDVLTTTLLECENGFGDGIGDFTLTDADAVVDVDGGNTVTYHIVQADADSGSSSLTSPYQNISDPQIIYARVEDGSGCYNTVEVILDMIIIPDGEVTAPIPFDPQIYCNGELIPDNVFEVLTTEDPNITTGFAWTSSQDIGFGTAGTGMISGQTATNTGTTVITSTITVQPYNFGPNTIDELGSNGSGDDCFDTSVAFTFDITVLPTPENDLCDDAINADAGTVFTNNCAAGEITDCGLDGSTSHDVFFTYNLSSADPVDIEIEILADNSNGTAITEASVGVYTDGCSTNLCPDDGFIFCDVVQGGTAIELVCINPASVPTLTFYVASADGDQGDFTIVVTESAAADLASNDECTSSMTASAGTTAVDNSCATATIGNCAGGMASQDVWFDYTTAAGTNSDVTIELVTNGTATQVSLIVVQDDCSTLIGTQAESEFCDFLDGGPAMFDCIPPATTIQIALSSLVCDAGTFDMIITETPNGVPNDICTDPIDVNALACQVVPVMATTTDACPEFDNSGDPTDFGSACDFDVDPTTWYSFTTTAETVEVDITSIVGGSLTIFENACPPTTIVTDGDCLSADQTGIVVDPNTTYLIAVTVPGGEGDVTFDIKLIDPPANDDCADAIAVGTGMTNACATLEVTETVGSCVGTQDQTVWFTYTVLDDVQDITISLANGTIANPSITAYIDPADGTATDCTSPEEVDGCINGTELILPCVSMGDVYYIAVNSVADDEGTFDISVAEGAPVVAGDVCETAINGRYTINPNHHILECNDVLTLESQPNTCPDPEADGTCVDEDDNGTWYYFDTEVDIAEIEITSLGGNFQLFTTPNLSTSATPRDCSDLTSVGCPATFPTDYGNIGFFMLVTGGDIQLTSSYEPANVNEDCASPDQSLTQGTTGTVTGNNICATGDANVTCNSASHEQGHVVYYEFTTDATMNQDITISIAPTGSVDAMTAGSITLFDDACTGVNTNIVQYSIDAGMDALECDGITVPVELECVPTGTTFYIAIGSNAFDIDEAGPREAGEFDLTVTAVDAAGPANDLCADATIVTASGTPLAGENNNCATYDIDAGSCGGNPGVAESSVWYQYVLSNDVQSITVTLAPSGAEPIANPSLVVYEDCVGTLYDPAGPSEDCAGAEVIIDCPVQGTLFIQVSSAFLETGEFDITVTEGDGVVIHDVCTDPMVLSLDDCMTQDVMIDNTNACPEPSDLGAGTTCGFDTNPTVWVEATIPAGGVGFDITMVGANTSLAIFDAGCPVTTGPYTPGCITADTELLGMAPGTYLIAVSSTEANEGIQTFTIKNIVPPSNDECAMADPLAAGTATTGTTECATVPLTGTCNETVSESTVWYTYTVGADNEHITVSVDNWMGMGDLYVATVVSCTDLTFLNQADLTTAQYCGPAGADLLEIHFDGTPMCYSAGDVITIVVASESGEPEGTFDITVNVVNDPTCQIFEDCGTADTSAFGEIETNVDPVECQPICNIDACPNMECGGTIYNAIYYQFTTDDDPALVAGDQVFLTVSLDGVTGMTAGETWINVYDAACGTTIMGCFNTDNTGPVDLTGTLMANTTYTVMVGTGDNVGGNADLCIEVTTGCVNDECDDAIMLDENTPLSTQTNACTEDANVYACGDLEQATAWYSFTLPVGFTGADINLSGFPGGVSWSILVFEDCADADPFDRDCESGTLMELRCLDDDQDYFIQIGTEAGMEASFDIEVDFLEPADIPGTPLNDLCDGAEIVSFVDCTLGTLSIDNTAACPDAGLDATGCNFGTEPTVWYQIDMPALGYGIEIENLSNGTYASLVDGCDPASSMILNTQGGAGCVNASDIWTVNELTTYYLAVGNMSEGLHSLDITILVSPPGDDPNGSTATTADDVIDFGVGGGSSSNTTCCAQGVNDDPNSDSPFRAPCSGANDDDAVWYMFTTDPNDDGYLIQATFSGGATGAVQVYLGNFDGDILGSDCDASTGVKIPNCYADPQVIWVKVGSPELSCGTFSLDALPTESCAEADECEDAPVFTTVTPADCGDGVNFQSVDGCMDLACPETIVNDCENGTFPTVWYAFEIDDPAAGALVTSVTADFEVAWNIYQGTSCADMVNIDEQVNAGEPAVPCGNADVLPHITPITTDDNGDLFMYWISITALTDPIENPNFTLTYASSLGCISCSGDNEFDCDNGDFEIMDENGDILEGPICPGATVMVCTEFTYDAMETGNDWLHALIPTLGNGWDLEASDLSSSMLGGGWMWIDENSGCDLELESDGINLPNLCTYEEDGVLKLCNTACNGGTCPCSGPLLDGEPIPAGWFWNSSGGTGGGCNGGTDCPITSYGVPNGNVVPVAVCFDLTAKLFDSSGECEDSNDLSISIQPLSDHVVGCWDDSTPCILDPSIDAPLIEMECDIPPPAIGGPVEICSGAMAGLDIATADGTALEIIVTAINNPNITGATDHNFLTGNGTINDVLVNTTAVVQIQQYETEVIDPDIVCDGPLTIVEVIVYPELIVAFNLLDPEPICYDEDGTFAPVVMGGTTNNYTYLWDDGSTGSDITIDNPGDFPVGISQMCVTVTDDLGCMGEACFNFDIRPELLVEINDDITTLCIDCDNTLPATNPDVTIGHTYVGDGSPILGNFSWEVFELDGNTVLASFEDGGELYIFDCMEQPFTNVPGGVMSTPGEYELILSGTDEYGCPFETEPIIFTVFEGPEITIDLVSCDATLGSVYTISTPPEGSPIITIENIDTPPSGVQYQTIFDSGDTDPPLQPGTYLITANYSNGDCPSMVELVVPELVPPVISSPSVCIGENGVAEILNCNDYATIQWDAAGAMGCTYTIPSITETTTFVITLTDDNMCASNVNVTIEVDANPEPMITGLSQFCSNTTLGVNDAFASYIWSIPSPNTDPTIVVDVDGTYSVTVTDENGCTGETSIDITSGDIEIDPVTETVCEGESVTLGITSSAGFTYQWSDSAGILTGEESSEYTTNVAGVYSLEVTDNNGQTPCSGTGIFTLVTTPLPIIALTPADDACDDIAGGNTVINLTNYEGTSDPGSWADDAAVFGGAFDETNLNFDGFPTGDYTFTYTTDANGECPPISEMITITVVPCSCPVQVGTIDDMCLDEGDNITIDLDNRESPQNYVDGSNWVWVTPQSEMFITNGTTAGSSLTIPDSTAAGVYILSYVLDGFTQDCSDDITFEIFTQPFAELVMDQDACNANTGVGQVCLDFTTFVVAGDMNGVWSVDPQYVIDYAAIANESDIDWTNVCFDGLTIGDSYEFTYTTASAEGPCTEESYTLEVDVVDCQCKDPSTLPMPTLCAEDRELMLSSFVAPSADAGNWTLISGPDVTSLNVTTTTISIFDTTVAGEYVFQYDNINPTGGDCIEFETQTLTIVAPPVAVLTEDNGQACSEVPLQTGGDSNFLNIGQYLDTAVSDAGDWSDDAGLLDGGQSIDNINFAGLTVGTVVTFTYTTNTAAGNLSPCDDVSVEFTVLIIDCDCPPINTMSPPDFCTTGGTYDLSDLEGNSADGTWDILSGPDVASIDLTGDILTIDMDSEPGVYELTFTLDDPVTDCTLFMTTESFEVIAPPVVSFDLASVCNEGSPTETELDLTDYFVAGSSTSGSTLGTSWSSPAEANGLDLSDPTQVDFTGLMSLSPITITFTTNDAVDPCIDVPAELIVTVNDCTVPPCPDLTVIDPDDVCNDGATVDLSAVEITPATTVAGTWSEDPGNATTGILSGTIVTVDASTTAGVYTFIFTPDVTPDILCPQTSSVELVVSQSVEAGEDGEIEYCDSESANIVLFDLLTGAETGGMWMETSAVPSTGTAFNQFAGTFNIDSQAPGLYIFVYTISATLPCQDDNSMVMVQINADPTSEAGDAMQLDCSGTPVTLDGSASSIGAEFTYEWILDGTVVQSGPDTDLSTNQDGIYTLTVINNVTGCRASDNVEVTLDPSIPTLEAVPCTDMGEGIIFITEMSGANTPFTLEITDSQGNVVQLIEDAENVTEVTNLDPDFYTVTLIDDEDCRSVPSSIIIVSAESIINNETDADTVEFGTLYTLDVDSFLINPDGIELIEWIDEAGNIICQQPTDDCSTIERLVERAELICLRVTDTQGCVNEDCIWLRFVIDNQVFTPNIFDPQGEENSWVYPQTDKTAMIPKFSVYDRWGNLIFVRENFDSNIPNLGWDGNYNGAKAEQGVYVYIYDAVFPNGEVKSVANDITLIR